LDYITPYRSTLFDASGGLGVALATLPTKLDSTTTSQELSEFKIVITGKIVECYKPQIPFKIGSRPSIPRFRGLREKEIISKSATRAKNTLRRLVQSNFDSNSKFITLTFANNKNFDITSLKSCYKQFNKFIMRLRYQYPGVKYVAVPEFQNKRQRGAVHYHLISDLPFIDNEKLSSLWGLGFIKINKVSSSLNVGLYVSKYLSKEFYQKKYKGFKTYYRSSNLINPIVVYGKKAKTFYQGLFERYSNKITFQSRYSSLHNGQVEYTEFSFYREEVNINASYV